MPRTLPTGLAALSLLAVAPAEADEPAVVRLVNAVREQLHECVEFDVSRLSPEERAKMAAKPEATQKTCPEVAKEYQATELGRCRIGSKTDKMSVLASYYAAVPTYEPGGYAEQCTEGRPGAWTDTPAGKKARAQVAADRAEEERLAKLPHASTEEISVDYASNEVTADAKYKGKATVVSGTTLSVQKDGERTYILAPGYDAFSSVRLYFTNQKFAEELTPGQVVELECTGTGTGPLKTPTFRCKT